MSSYRFVHNKIFYAFDLLASLLLLCLTVFEAPAVRGLEVDKSVSTRLVSAVTLIVLSFQVHVSTELLCLTVISIECWMKLRWMGLRSFITHPRTVIKVSCIFVMFIDALLTLVMRRPDFRVIRALRPVFLIDNHFCYTIRR